MVLRPELIEQLKNRRKGANKLMRLRLGDGQGVDYVATALGEFRLRGKRPSDDSI